MKSVPFLLAASLPLLASATPCPYAEMHKAGVMNDHEAATFEAIRRDPSAADDLLRRRAHERAHREKRLAKEWFERKRESDGQSDGQLDLGSGADTTQQGEQNSDNIFGLNLPLGGGIVNGVLQPLTGPLQNLDLPVPQPQGFKEIPGDDPDHQFQAPGPTDQRGICPTLNALANHGYMSRDGITSFAESANAVQTAYGFIYELSVFLAAVGLLAAGDLVTGKYSIGGADDRVPNTLGPALGLDKHGVFEIDGSITREDGYFGNNANFLKQRWDEYLDQANSIGNGQFNLEVNAHGNGLRYDYSRQTNPQFFAGPVWFIVSHAERVFVYEGLANGTQTGAGDAGYDNIAPFFLNETFPDQWFRRGVPFTLPGAFQQAGQMFAITHKITTASPAEMACFLLEVILDLTPGQIAADNKEIYEGFLNGVVAPLFVNDGFFNCNVTAFVEPSNLAGVDPNTGSQSASGSPVNGAYPGIGIIKPDSQPS